MKNDINSLNMILIMLKAKVQADRKNLADLLRMKRAVDKLAKFKMSLN